MSQQQSIGSLNVSRLIWSATIISLGTIYYCWATCNLDNPSILTSALEYPNTIILRVGVMFSLFILFLVIFCIQWWLDSTKKAKSTRRATVVGIIALMSYALFISTIDRLVINYYIAEWAVFIACICNFIAISSIFKNIKQIREEDPYFIGRRSWSLKKVFYYSFLGFMLSGVLIYLGQLDIELKNQIEYGVVTASYLFYWTFSLDFKKYELDVEKLHGNGESD